MKYGHVELAVWLQLVEQVANNEAEFIDAAWLEFATIELMEEEWAA